MALPKKESVAKVAKTATKTVKTAKLTERAAKPRVKEEAAVRLAVSSEAAGEGTAKQTAGGTSVQLLKAWLDGWRKTFVLKGRSSRFELWGFLLLNAIMMVIVQLKCAYIMSERYLIAAHARGVGLDVISRHITIAEAVFYLSVFIPLFPFVSLIVRRMHDLGKLAWANYLEPLFMSVVVMSLLLVALLELNDTDYAYTALCLGVCFVTLLYGAGFYGLKVLIMTMFYRGDCCENEYGLPQYNDDEHEAKALNLSCFYFLFVVTIGVLYLVIAIV